MAFLAPGFKKPSLPFFKSFDDVASGQGSVETNARPGQPASNSDTAAPKPFRPMSCRPQDEIGAATARRPPPHQSFFGNSQFSFDSVASNPNLDDSGYFSTSMSEQNVNEGDRFAGAPASRSDAPRLTQILTPPSQIRRSASDRLLLATERRTLSWALDPTNFRSGLVFVVALCVLTVLRPRPPRSELCFLEERKPSYSRPTFPTLQR